MTTTPKDHTLELIDFPAWDTCVWLKHNYTVFHNSMSTAVADAFHKTMQAFAVSYNEDHYYWDFIGPNHNDLLRLQAVAPAPLCLTIGLRDDDSAWVDLVSKLKRLKFFKTPFQVFVEMSNKQRGVLLEIDPGVVFRGMIVDHVVYENDTVLKKLCQDACEVLLKQEFYDPHAYDPTNPMYDPMPD